MAGGVSWAALEIECHPKNRIPVNCARAKSDCLVDSEVKTLQSFNADFLPRNR
jgi:hypothetical protein